MAPVLIGCATLAGRRWGARAGGLVSAFPAVVGPLLLLTAQAHGAEFTARAANGILLGLPALAAFALAYSRVALHGRWGTSLVAGWLAAALAAALGGYFAKGVGLPGGVGIAGVSSALAYVAMPAAPETSAAVPAQLRRELPLRMTLTAALVVLLATAAKLFGALVGGLLAGLPVLASVLSVCTHRSGSSAEVVDLARGMLSGLVAFVTFCGVVAALIVPAGTVLAFAAAIGSTVGLQALAVGISRLLYRRASRSRSSAALRTA